jgi:hypothetical protein
MRRSSKSSSQQQQASARGCTTPCYPNCRLHPRDWVPDNRWRRSGGASGKQWLRPPWQNASYSPTLHTVRCGVYDPSGTIVINNTFFLFPDGAFSNTHYASTDLLRWHLRNTSWFNGLTGGISATKSGIYAHWVPNGAKTAYGNRPVRAVANLPVHGGGAGEESNLGMLDHWQCDSVPRGPASHPCQPVGGPPAAFGNPGNVHDAGRALQLLPHDSSAPWFLVAGGPGSSWGATNLATLWLLQAKDDTLAEFTKGGAFFSLQDSYGRVNGPTNMWSNESVPLGTLECGEVFYMSAEKLVVTAGVYRKGVTQTSEWFVGRKVRNSSSSSGWTFQTMHRGHIDYGNYYSAKTAYEAFPSSVGGGRHVVFGEALPVGPTPPGGSKDGVGAVAP